MDVPMNSLESRAGSLIIENPDSLLPPELMPVQRTWGRVGKARVYSADLFTSAAHAPWWRLWSWIFAFYIISWGFWAFILWFVNIFDGDAECLKHAYEGETTQFFDYYFYVVETMATIGYGVYHLECRYLSWSVSLMSLHSSALDVSVFGVVLAKLARPGRREGSIFLSDKLCGHMPTGIVAFRLINVRQHAVQQPNLKVFLVTARAGHMPDFCELPFKLSIPMEFLEFPQTVSVSLGSLDNRDNKYLVAIFTAMDDISGGTFEVRKRWSLAADLKLGEDFASMISDQECNHASLLRTNLNLDRFQDVVQADPSWPPSWASGPEPVAE